MADATIQIGGLGSQAAPLDYKASGTQSLGLVAVRAQFDGSAAASAWRPAIQILSAAGSVMAQTFSDTVASGSTADVTFFPFRRRISSAASSRTYAQVISSLQATHTLVAEWDLTEGATPYADTSGFAPGDPSTMVTQVRTVPMTQRFTPGPFAGAQGGPAVGFNFDGTSLTSSGDFLTDAIITPSRYYFLGNLPFTVIMWVAPFVSGNTHDGPVLNTIHVTGFGSPGAHDDGWRLNVTEPGLIPQIQRAADVLAAGSYDTASGTALSTATYSMLGGSYDGANLTLCVNGVLQSTVASAGAITGAAVNAQIGAGPTKLGGSVAWYFGAAARGSVWSSALTPAEQLQLFVAGTTA